MGSSVTNAWFLILNIPREVVFEHTKFHAMYLLALKPLMKHKWNIVVSKRSRI